MKGHPVHYATLAVVAGATYSFLMLAFVHPHNPVWMLVPLAAVISFVALLAAEHRRHTH